MRVIRPQPGPQEEFLSSSADITIFGGSAGVGKTYGLLMEPTRHLHRASFGAVIFRRTRPQLTVEGGMWDESHTLYKPMNGRPNSTLLHWDFPAESRVTFAGLQYESDIYSYDGAQIPLLAFDQLESFTEKQWWYLQSRNRTTMGIRPYTRATCNPKPGSWLERLLEWWIYQDPEDEEWYGYAIPERSGSVRFFIRINKEIFWADSPETLMKKYGRERHEITSLAFIPGTVYDNRILMQEDPAYLARLKNLDRVERLRLLGEGKKGGNWKVQPEAGSIFDRNWVTIVRVPPPPTDTSDVFFWDLAATEKEIVGNKSNAPSWTAGVHMRRPNTRFTVMHMTAFQEGPATVEERFISESIERTRYTNRPLVVAWEREPGSASKREAYRLQRRLLEEAAKNNVVIRPKPVLSRIDKYERFRPFATIAKAGDVQVLEGHWNERFLAHLHGQPQKENDIMDATSGSAQILLAGSGESSSSGMSIKAN